LDHGRIRRVPLDSIRPSPENDKLYKPVRCDAEDIIDLANSIRQFGVKEPIIITLDSYIISGHRRHAACLLLGLKEVPVRVENILSTDPAFLSLLLACNRQRVKGIDEIAREQVIGISQEEAYSELLAHRRKNSATTASAAGRVVLGGRKKRAAISEAKVPLLNAVLRILDDYDDFLPLTDRRIHYYLLNNPPLIHASKPDSVYKNDHKSYKAVVDILTRGRLDGSIPFEAIIDPTRPISVWDCHNDVTPFLRRELNDFLKGYRRNLQRNQPNHIEIVGEKNTIDSIIRPVAANYCIPTTIGRGYASLGPRREMAERFAKSGKEKLIVLIMSDFDPEGEDIAESFPRSMRDDLRIRKVEAFKMCLTAQQVKDIGLPASYQKVKEKSSRAAKFIKRHGRDVYELEAVPPRRLQRIIRNSIETVMDMEAFEAECEAEKQDAQALATIRAKVRSQIQIAA
jgi:ParB/RepB/Spo0J family partition protein